MADIAANYAIGVPQSALLPPLDQVFIPTRGLAVEISALASGLVGNVAVYRVSAVSDDPFHYWDSPAVLYIEGDALDPGVTNLRNATPSAPASVRLPAGYAGFIISVDGSSTLTLNWTLRCPKMAPSQWEP